ncbi:MAG: hypothetical protein M3P93_08815, partial [Actinomycetota bacterium]|nr:hypothetical protein [Actinomycetota bacterium]
MPPIDDELRAALAGRAAMLAPPADPMAGIERRARSIRRRRTGASVAGTALAVLAVVGVGATLTLVEPAPRHGAGRHAGPDRGARARRRPRRRRRPTRPR